MADKYVKELGIKNRPCFKIVEIPWFGFEELSQLETMIVDAPPVPPDPSFIPYKNVADKVNITIKTNSGEEFLYIWSVKDKKWYYKDEDWPNSRWEEL